jgi:hypothetical protein
MFAGGMRDTSLYRVLAGALLASACAGGWQGERASRPVSRVELASCRVTVSGAEPLAGDLREALAQQGFTVVAHPPYQGDLELRVAMGVATLTSDEFFVEEVRAPDARSMAEALAASKRVADFVRNSGTVQQRDVVN